MKIGWTLWAAVGIVALAAGCAKPKTSGFTVGADVDADGNPQQVLQVDNAKLARLLIVEETSVGQTKNGLMKVGVKLTSRLNKTFVAQSKFVWLDETGAEIDPDTDPWRALVLNGKETRTSQGVAPNSAATAFRLRVREGEKTRWVIP